jgi:hypothetical protein
MQVTLHVELTDDGISWWAESATHPPFSAAAPTLSELKDLVRAAAQMEGWPPPRFSIPGDDSKSDDYAMVVSPAAS